MKDEQAPWVQLPPSNPAVVAWDAFKMTPGYQSALRYEPSRIYALWIAFWHGYQAAAAAIDSETFPQEPKYALRGGRVINRASGEAIPLDEPIMIFRGRDKYAAGVIQFYLAMLLNVAHRVAVGDRLRDFNRFREQFPDRMREPDTDLAGGQG
jgi:hypothetical protein